jgi:hypothetical protein
MVAIARRDGREAMACFVSCYVPSALCFACVSLRQDPCVLLGVMQSRGY